MFYDRFAELCSGRNISANKAATDIGLSNSTVTKWKKTGAVPQTATLSKIAEYFNVSINYLLGETEEPEEEIKKDPTPKTGNEVSDLDAFTLNILHKLTPEFQEKAIAHLLELAAKSANNE